MEESRTKRNVLGCLASCGSEEVLGMGWEDRETQRETVELLSRVHIVKEYALGGNVTSLLGMTFAWSWNLSWITMNKPKY